MSIAESSTSQEELFEDVLLSSLECRRLPLVAADYTIDQVDFILDGEESRAAMRTCRSLDVKKEKMAIYEVSFSFYASTFPRRH